MDDSISSHLWRMDWGFGNPNKTAAFIALTIIFSWLLAYLHRKGFWAALTLFTGFGVCLLLTQSRGGLVGATIGCLIVLAWVPRPYSRIRTSAVAFACLALFIFSFFIKPAPHMVKGVVSADRSVENRLLIWKEVPAMIHDAPHGWGLGKSGEAYRQWYQPVSRGEGYRTLVNSHFTWLVEFGWSGRILYLLFWISCFIILWPSPNYDWFSIPLGVWSAFGICSFFSSVAEAPLIWLIPILALTAVLLARFKANTWPSLKFWISGVAATIVVIGGFLLWEQIISNSVVHDDASHVVTLGLRAPNIWLIAPNENILGEHYGHEIRRAFGTSSALQQRGVGIAPNLQHVPQNSVLIFSGRLPESFTTLHPTELILINPRPVSAEVLKSLATLPRVTIIVGEYSQNREFWSDHVANSHITLRVVSGSEEYIGDFMSIISDIIKN